MAKTATETKTKRATKAAKAAPVEKKAKRAPTAYNLFMKEQLKKYREEHPGTAQKDAMKAVGLMWRDAPENPRRGEEPKPKAAPKKAAPKAATKSRKVADETATSDVEADSDE